MLEEELRGASARGNLELVKDLLNQGAVFAPDTSGRTPLHLSCAAGHVEIVKLFINPKNINSIDSVGRTPLQIAASCGHVEVVDILIQNGANVNSRDCQNGNTALHEASWLGLSQTLAILAKGNTELDLPNSCGFSPIHLACQNGHNQSCRELLLAGANPNAQNNYGDAALHTSARYGHAGVARILLSAGSKPSLQNKNGDTALHISAAMGRRKLTNIFLEAGCDKTLKNKQFETARDIAMRKGHIEIVNILDKTNKIKKNKVHNKKSSETSDSDKKSKDHSRKSGHSGEEIRELKDGEVPHWSPYGCHYYPDLSLFPQPNLDSLPCEPLSKGEQYFLDLAGNICKGPVGVGLTCHCRNFVLDMESRLERHSAEVRTRLKVARAKIEHRVNKTEGILNQYISNGRHRSSKRSQRSNQRSRSLDLLSTEELAERIKNTHIDIENKCKNILMKSSDSEEVRSAGTKNSSKGIKTSDNEKKVKSKTINSHHDIQPAPRLSHLVQPAPRTQVEPLPRTTTAIVEPAPRRKFMKSESLPNSNDDKSDVHSSQANLTNLKPNQILVNENDLKSDLNKLTYYSIDPDEKSNELAMSDDSNPNQDVSTHLIQNSNIVELSNQIKTQLPQIQPTINPAELLIKIPQIESVCSTSPTDFPPAQPKPRTQPTLIHSCQPIAHSSQQSVKRENQNAIQTFSVQV